MLLISLQSSNIITEGKYRLSLEAKQAWTGLEDTSKMKFEKVEGKLLYLLTKIREPVQN
jgi:hypothetical protein